MKFFQPETAWDVFKRKLPQGASIDEAITAIRNEGMQRRNFTQRSDFMIAAACLQSERKWMLCRKPYYKVWPSIAKSLLRVSLDVSPQTIQFPFPCLAVRFAEADNHLSRFRSFLMTRTKDDRRIDVIFISWGVTRLDDNGHGLGGAFSIRLDQETIGHGLMRDRELLRDLGIAITDDHKTLTSIALSVCLMAKDPDLFIPDVLAKDRQRFDQSKDPELRQRLIDKASRRGVAGWRIGEKYEAVPHYRRPHFALRHTGKGGTVPRIVPVKGAVVHRQKLTQVPTGYLTPEGAEVES